VFVVVVGVNRHQTKHVHRTCARFTEDLRMILRQFSHLRSSYDNDLIHRTLTTYLQSDRSCDRLRQVLFVNSLKTCRRPITILGYLNFCVVIVLRHHKTNLMTMSESCPWTAAGPLIGSRGEEGGGSRCPAQGPEVPGGPLRLLETDLAKTLSDIILV